ncbi:MAG: DNA-protecting protein DprA [Acidobacteriaceae bacterium]|nr:DNA-protecting protein DprA [Acidobacteriaceae bacterium]MBV8572613.1 DNA-protecting protein DprA [Acidobacteriaceae bacterium]
MPTSVLTPDETLHWLALQMVPGLGTVSVLKLLKALKSPQAVFRASTSELEGLGISPGQARNVASGCSFDDALEQQQKALSAGAAIVPLHDPRYPARLREIFDPPLVLFALGKLDLLATYSIAVVGTRRPTPYGIAAAERLAADLAKAGLTIVSGMAQGVDTAAHRATLRESGSTVAVFGCGVDVLYPASNRKLYDDIARTGLLLSEFPMGAPAYPQNFPIRNRIVSGLSLGVVIIEGAQYSGSAITAKLAMDQGREVFAVPGNITSKMSWGPNLLIKEGGAKLVQEWSDVTNELPAAVRRDLVRQAQEAALPGDAASPEIPEEPMKALSRRLLATLQVDVPQQLESLLESFEGVSSSELIGALFDLEMAGLVRQLPGKHFIKVW